jgi:hypothetical protein
MHLEEYGVAAADGLRQLVTQFTRVDLTCGLGLGEAGIDPSALLDGFDPERRSTVQPSTGAIVAAPRR